MPRSSTRTALLTVLGGLVVVTLFTLSGNPAGATTTTTVLEKATWDALPTGTMSAAEFNSQLPSVNKSDAVFEDASVAADTRGSGHVFRLRLEAGTIWRKPTGNHGIVTFVNLPKQVDNACMSYDIRFSSGFDWSKGGKLPGLSGVAPGVDEGLPAGGGKPGDKGWSGRLMWRTPTTLDPAVAKQGSPDMATQYMYSASQQDYYGDVLPWMQRFVAGTWHHVKICYVMNTVGRADGVLRTWLDGNPGLDRTGYVYRTRNDVHIGDLMWSIFRGGSTLDWAGDTTGYVDIDNVLITTQS